MCFLLLLDVTGQWYYPGTLVSSTNKIDHQDNIAEILLKVALNTIAIPPTVISCILSLTPDKRLVSLSTNFLCKGFRLDTVSVEHKNPGKIYNNHCCRLGLSLSMFMSSFNNHFVIPWWSVSLMEETEVRDTLKKPRIK